jgi:ribosomal protein L12E/L44/L45/RPP1/RPP2
MPRFVTALSAGVIATLLAGGTALTTTPAAAAPMTDADRAAQKKATADCKAEVKEKAKYEAMSWYARHEAVKNCVKEKLAGSH